MSLSIGMFHKPIGLDIMTAESIVRAVWCCVHEKEENIPPNLIG